MKSTRTPHVATGVTSEELEITFGPAGMEHGVTVPAGTRCVKLDGGSHPWVVDDLSFIDYKQGLLYHDAYILGIRVPEEKIVGIKPERSKP